MQDEEDNVANQFAAPHEPDHKTDPEEDLKRLRDMSVADVIREYLGFRDQLDQRRAEWKAFETETKARLEMMSMVMREQADKLGVDAFPIRGLGTAYRNSKDSYRVKDWEAFTSWIYDTKNFQCLEKRVAKLATVEVEKATGEVPPGVDKTSEVEFLVRRNA